MSIEAGRYVWKPLATADFVRRNEYFHEHLNAHDYAQLNTIYTHLDSLSSTIAGPTAGGQAGNHPGTFGSLVSGSVWQGHGVFLRDFGNGNKTVTFVTWA